MSHLGKCSFPIRALLFLICLSSAQKPLHAQTDKIQQCVDAIKVAYYSQDADYHTDGQRIVWVKSYKKWTPEDLTTLQKKDSVTIRFFLQAINHNRLDVLEQLLPDYYRTHGGVKAFAADIQKPRS